MGGGTHSSTGRVRRNHCPRNCSWGHAPGSRSPEEGLRIPEMPWCLQGFMVDPEAPISPLRHRAHVRS